MTAWIWVAKLKPAERKRKLLLYYYRTVFDLDSFMFNNHNNLTLWEKKVEYIVIGSVHPLSFHFYYILFQLYVYHTGKCISRFAGIYAYCRYFIDRKW